MPTARLAGLLEDTRALANALDDLDLASFCRFMDGEVAPELTSAEYEAVSRFIASLATDVERMQECVRRFEPGAGRELSERRTDRPRWAN